MARLLPVGKQNFKNIRENGYVYVDKTRYVWELASTGLSYFLSRPRRFGKSLFVSTLESYFSGDKELFKGLYIEDKENARGEEAWAKYPIITFSLSGGQYNTEEGLGIKLGQALDVVEEKYGLKYYDADLSGRFENIIRKLYEKTGRQVVVLVDEYDKPLLSTMTSNPLQEEKNRQLFKGFFSVLKDMDGYLKFVMFTGVTKFSKVSVFSDLNQLKDISMDKRYSGICGITEDELTEVFQPEIRSLAAEQKMSYEQCMEELAKMYDGYHFSVGGVGVYNPFSILNAFDERNFGSYWFETGTPDFLIKKLESSRLPLNQLTDGVSATESALMNYRGDDPDPVPLFYQSGYLTICGYDSRFRNYRLRFPNEEVKYGFLESLAKSVLGDGPQNNPLALDQLILDLESGNLDSFMYRLTALFASIPYPEGKTPPYEGEWSRQIYLILSLMGAYVQCEVHMATGRADCVVQTSDYIYVFEFKLDTSVEDAMSQINDRGYTIPYLADSRKLYKVAVVFSTEKRNISTWKKSQ